MEVGLHNTITTTQQHNNNNKVELDLHNNTTRHPMCVCTCVYLFFYVDNKEVLKCLVLKNPGDDTMSHRVGGIQTR